MVARSSNSVGSSSPCTTCHGEISGNQLALPLKRLLRIEKFTPFQIFHHRALTSKIGLWHATDNAEIVFVAPLHEKSAIGRNGAMPLRRQLIDDDDLIFTMLKFRRLCDAHVNGALAAF